MQRLVEQHEDQFPHLDTLCACLKTLAAAAEASRLLGGPSRRRSRGRLLPEEEEGGDGDLLVPPSTEEGEAILVSPLMAKVMLFVEIDGEHSLARSLFTWHV